MTKSRQLKPSDLLKPKPGKHLDGAGLYLHVDDRGARFVYRWKQNERSRYLGLGSASALSIADAQKRLAEARKAATEARDIVRAGGDPIATKRAEKDAREGKLTWRAVAQSFLEDKRAGWSSKKHVEEWERSLIVFCEPFLDARIDEITEEHVLAALKPLWVEKNETAKRVRGRIEAVLDYARAKKLRSGENPARWRGNLAQILPNIRREVRHHDALDWKKAPAFVAELRSDGTLGPRVLEFALLTGSRIGEATGATWDEINLDDRVWIKPHGRTKQRREHIVPLCERAMDLLQEARGQFSKGTIFPGMRGAEIAGDTVLQLGKRVARRIGIEENVTTHGFRSTFKTWAVASHGADWTLAEEALAHKFGTKVSQAYWRGHELETLRALYEAWSRYLARQEGNVVPLRRA
jgi:integrase